MSSREITLVFRGSSRFSSEGAEDDYWLDNEGIVSELNRQEEEISRAITRRLREVLPDDILIVVRIHFQAGSITWLGFVTIFDWMGRLAGVVGFIEYIQRAVDVAVSRSVSEKLSPWKPQRLQSQVLLTGAHELPKPDTAPVSQEHPSLLVLFLLVLNTTMLAVLLAGVFGQ
jgi:hypothetical protein